MDNLEQISDAKLYQVDEVGNIDPFVPDNQYEVSTTDLGTRLLVSTNEDRIEILKRILDLFPGPFFLTVVVQQSHGSFSKEGRLSSEKGKTRTQVDFFLDHFHDFISYGGMFHFWVSCESSTGIVVYDQHDYFFIYERAREAEWMFREMGYREDPIIRDFMHGHDERVDIVPGTKEILDYDKWWWTPLEYTDVRRPEAKTLKNLFLRIRHEIALRKFKKRK